MLHVKGKDPYVEGVMQCCRFWRSRLSQDLEAEVRRDGIRGRDTDTEKLSQPKINK